MKPQLPHCYFSSVKNCADGTQEFKVGPSGETVTKGVPEQQHMAISKSHLAGRHDMEHRSDSEFCTEFLYFSEERYVYPWFSQEPWR